MWVDGQRGGRGQHREARSFSPLADQREPGQSRAEPAGAGALTPQLSLAAALRFHGPRSGLAARERRARQRTVLWQLSRHHAPRPRADNRRIPPTLTPALAEGQLATSTPASTAQPVVSSRPRRAARIPTSKRSPAQPRAWRLWNSQQITSACSTWTAILWPRTVEFYQASTPVAACSPHASALRARCSAAAPTAFRPSDGTVNFVPRRCWSCYELLGEAATGNTSAQRSHRADPRSWIRIRTGSTAPRFRRRNKNGNNTDTAMIRLSSGAVGIIRWSGGVAREQRGDASPAP